MTYLSHFGLAIPPFASTPDPSFFFPSHDYSNIVASLEFAIRRDFGIVKLVGPEGSGKTTLSRLLQGNLARDHGSVAMLDARAAGRILPALCESFGLQPGNDPFEALKRHLLSQNHFGRLTVAIIDEAHRLDAEDFKALIRLERLEAEKKKLLQIVLLGHEQLDERLQEPDSGELARYIVFSLSTKPLSEAESRRYLLHRLRLARQVPPETEADDHPVFTEAALDQLARWSGGVPHVLNLLAERALQKACDESSKLVQPGHVLAAAKAYPGLVVGRPSRLSLLRPGKRRVVLLTGLLLLALIAVGGSFWLRHGASNMAAPKPLETPPPVEAPRPIEAPKPVEVLKPVEPPKPVLPTKPVEPPKSAEPPPVVKPVPAPAPVVPEIVPEAAPPKPALPETKPVPKPPKPAPKPAKAAKTPTKAAPAPASVPAATEEAPPQPRPGQISPDDAAPPPPSVPAVPTPKETPDVDANDAVRAGAGVYPGHKR